MHTKESFAIGPGKQTTGTTPKTLFPSSWRRRPCAAMSEPKSYNLPMIPLVKGEYLKNIRSSYTITKGK